MSSPKRNEWLDAQDSQDDGGEAYDSDAVEDSRVVRASKRRKMSPLHDSHASSPREEDMDERSDQSDAISPPSQVHGPGARPPATETHQAVPLHSASQDADFSHQLPKSLIKSQNKASKTGVIYLSRVPPYMKPQTVKQLLSSFGYIGRIFLTPEDPTSHARRVKSGGNKKRSFTDGWVEFLRKKDAKLVAGTLNAQIIGGKKGGWYHDDVWNIKYLKGFKWHHLTEQIANENAERAARLRTEIAQTTRENKRFVANVERAKMLEGMKSKKRKKIDSEGTRSEPALGPREDTKDGAEEVKRHFKQNDVRVKARKDTEQTEDVRRVLAKIF